MAKLSVTIIQCSAIGIFGDFFFGKTLGVKLPSAQYLVCVAISCGSNQVLTGLVLGHCRGNSIFCGLEPSKVNIERFA